MAPDDIDLITLALHNSLDAARALQLIAVDELQEGAATTSVTALRITTMQSAILAIGAFSILEAMLQHSNDWRDPFREVDARLRNTDQKALAERFSHFRDAINVLKHGKGRSYRRLLEVHDTLPFRVKAEGEYFFEEGDVGEVATLINADFDFVDQCARVIDDILSALSRSNSSTHLSD